MEKNSRDGKNGLYILALVLLAGPFYVNDFANLYVKSWPWWLFIDYAGVKFFPLAVVFWMIHSKKMKANQFGLETACGVSFVLVVVVVTLAGTLIDQNFYPLISTFPGYKALGSMPQIGNIVWNWVDLTFGLFMVGVCEELVFRGFLHTFLGRYFKRSWVILVISSVAFGLIHWSLGLHAVVVTSIIGALFMGFYLKTRSLPAIMIAHFLINFIDFAGVIPKSLFRFV
ncbi:MAG: CPBP family intramembrane metalloprotease [Proteobacteria bacterium]|nr:CPBP family intramembrane metalloprotease [Pseudomonadota bacterium]